MIPAKIFSGGVQKLSEGVDKFFLDGGERLRYFQKSFMGGLRLF